MTPKATSPALQKNAANANKLKTLENADGGRPAGFPLVGSGEPERSAAGLSAPGSRTRRRSQTSIASAAAAGIMSTAKAAVIYLIATSTAETSSGPGAPQPDRGTCGRRSRGPGQPAR